MCDTCASFMGAFCWKDCNQTTFGPAFVDPCGFCVLTSGNVGSLSPVAPSNVCQNNATCLSRAYTQSTNTSALALLFGNSTALYRCNCVAGFAGQNCSVN